MIFNLLDNIIHLNIDHILILINRIIKHNPLNTTNVNSIIRIEWKNKLVPEMIMIEAKWENMAIFTPTHDNNKITHYSIGKLLLCKKEEPNLFFFDFVNTRNNKNA